MSAYSDFGVPGLILCRPIDAYGLPARKCSGRHRFLLCNYCFHYKKTDLRGTPIQSVFVRFFVFQYSCQLESTLSCPAII